ncbi:dTDP-4-dehydrorhamnose reductase [Mycobacterium sp. 1274756.6]|nr:dTDP-4-dehydrorhamnose reductase [Mycobacterium sp. 1274756.6]
MITGAGGQVGTALAAEAARRARPVAAFTSADWDITDPAAATGRLHRGDVVINCAAYTDVDGAETDRARAAAVNTTGPGHLAAACARAGARLIHISTDYVFSGEFAGPPRPYRPPDPTGPLNVYGQTKLAGEQAVLAALPQARIVRTAWVYTGGAGNDFVAAMRRLAAGSEPVEMVDDQIGSPTYVADLVAALLAVADEDPGAGEAIRHAANRGAVSRFEQARAVFAEVGADPQRVRPVPSSHRPRPARRPGYSALAAAGVAPLRGWREALAAALAERPLSSTP